MKIRHRVAALPLSLCLILGTGSAFAAAGSLDPKFRANGIVQASLGGNFQPPDALLAPSGDIVAAGTTTNSIIARYLPSAPDTSFGLEPPGHFPDPRTLPNPSQEVLLASSCKVNEMCAVAMKQQPASGRNCDERATIQ